ncbi:MAG: glycoside hydrolase family 2 protein, partial [Lachnospiraceae bacterium]|nr:glycoside hydrolase family 2 protein [Lachnospiraceae bacterium]
MIFQSLNGTWMMNEKGSEAYIEAKVPGSVLSALLVQHRIQDPYFGTNEYQARELFRNDYFFSREFEVMPELMQQDRVRLCCKGIDTLSNIYINGNPVGSTSNMNRTYNFDVKEYLRPGINLITVELLSPLQYIEHYHTGYDKDIYHTPQGSMEGAQFIRKPHSQFGWDWGPQLPDMGIFREIRLEAWSKVKLKEVFFYQEHIEGNVTLFVDPILEYTDPIPVEIVVSVTDEPASALMTRMPDPGTVNTVKGENEIGIPIRDPKLWWPNGCGKHPLYDVKVELRKADKV